MSDALEKRISEWLVTTGLAFEYETFQAFQNAGLNAAIGEHYFEPKREIYREIDVQVVESFEEGENALDVFVACECKGAKSGAWVLIESGRIFDKSDWRHVPTTARLRSNELSNAVADARDLHFVNENSLGCRLLLAPGDDNRKGQGDNKQKQGDNKQKQGDNKQKQGDNKQKGEKEDAGYHAVQQVSSAAWSIVIEGQEVIGGPQRLVIPCLVVDQPLYRAVFDQNAGTFRLAKTSIAQLRWTGYEGGTIVDVVVKSRLSEYAEECKTTIETLGSKYIRYAKPESYIL